MPLGLFEQISSADDHADVVVGFVKRRIDAEQLFPARDGLLFHALGVQRRCQRVIGEDIFGLQPDQALPRVDRLLPLADHLVSAGEVAQRIGEIRFEGDRIFVRDDGVVVLADRTENLAEVVPRRVHLGRDFERGVDELNRVRVLPDLVGDYAEEVKRVGMPRPLLENLPVRRLRLRQPPVAVMA